jgi:hypothetical protein
VRSCDAPAPQTCEMTAHRAIAIADAAAARVKRE